MTIAYVQEKKGSFTNVDSTTLTFDNPVAEGSAVVVTMWGYHAAANGTMFPQGCITDTESSTYNRLEERAADADVSSAIHVAYNVAGGSSFQVTLDPLTTGNYGGWAISEVSGLSKNVTPYIASTSHVVNDAAAVAITVGATAGLSQARNIVFAAMSSRNDKASITVESVSPAWTEIYEELDWDVYTPGESVYRIIDSTSGQSCSWTYSGAGRVSAVLAVFEEAPDIDSVTPSTVANAETGVDAAGYSFGPATLDILIDRYIAASSDDAAQGPGTTVTLNGTTSANDLDASTEYVGLRFLDFPIPQGATIVSATLSVVPASSTVDEPLVNIHLQDSDNAGTFTTTASDISSRPVTAATAWSSSNLGANGTTYYDAPDLASRVQTVVNRGGWTPGNALAVIIQSQGTSTRDLSIIMYDNGSLFPRFRVTYTGVAKLELASSSDYAAATKVAQTVTNWTDTAIEFTVVQGGLSNGSVWAFVTRADGSRSDGFEITLGAGAAGQPMTLRLGGIPHMTNRPLTGRSW